MEGQLDKTVLRNAVILTYRNELIARYSDQSIQSFKELKSLSSDKIKCLRLFFLTHLYPELTARPMRDAAFDNLGSVITSPKKMVPLMGSAISSIWTLGLQMPAAIKAGWRTLEAYLESQRLELALLKQAEILAFSADDLNDRQSLSKLMQAVPKVEVIRFRNDILKLFESLANVKLLKKTLSVMRNSHSIMDNRNDLYSQSEKDGLEMGISMLESGYALFSSLNQDEVILVLKGIRIIETAWYEDLLKAQD